MNLKLTKITKFLLDFMYFAGMLVCLTLPSYTKDDDDRTTICLLSTTGRLS